MHKFIVHVNEINMLCVIFFLVYLFKNNLRYPSAFPLYCDLHIKYLFRKFLLYFAEDYVKY